MVFHHANDRRERGADGKEGSVKKGQGAKQRKTLLEIKHGPAASGEAGKHLALLKAYRMAVAAQALKDAQAVKNGGRFRRIDPKQFTSHENREGVTVDELRREILALVEAERQAIPKLKDQVVESCLKIVNQPKTLRDLFKIAKRNRDGARAAYPDEEIVREFYDAGERSYQKLFKLAQLKNDNITASTFSRIVSRYGLVLQKSKPGRKALHEKRTSVVPSEISLPWWEEGIGRAEVERRWKKAGEQIERDWLNHKKEDAKIVAQVARHSAKQKGQVKTGRKKR